MVFSFCYIWQLMLTLFFILHYAEAQESRFTFNGRILDAVSLRPISGAHILGANQQTISDSEGRFQIQVAPPTKLRITHVSYESKVWEITNDMTSGETINLFPATVDLDVITVNPLPEEEEFKMLILQSEVSLSREEVNLQQNTSFIRSIQHLGNFNDMNSYDMFLGRIKDGGTVSILSNNPSLGIIGLIRRLRQDKTVPGRTPHSDHIPSLWKAYNRKDGNYKWLFE